MSNRSRGIIVRTAAASALLVAGAVAATGCSSGQSTMDGVAGASPLVGAGTAPESTAGPGSDAAESSNQGQVTREQAERAALAAIGEGRVTWVGAEDDRGAAWEVEITRPDGSEVDVLVAADGSIVAAVEPVASSRDDNAGTTDSPGDRVTRQEAERLAVEAVGGGDVTWSGPEDDRGAAWEIEVTRPDGSEVDVLIDADGNVVS